MEKKYFIRMGSNSEKAYIYKTGSLFSGLIVKANFFETSKGMITGIVLKLKSLKKSFDFIIDPITYVYGLDPYNDWSIRSWQKVKAEKADEILRDNLNIPDNESIPANWIRNTDTSKIEVLSLKKSYKKLSDCYFNNIDSIKTEVGKKEITSDYFNNSNISIFNKNVIDYQLHSLISYFSESKYSGFDLPKPSFILSPYFHVYNDTQFEFMIKIWNDFKKQYNENNGAFVFLSTLSYLKSNLNNIIDYFCGTGIQNLFFWFDDYDEYDASLNENSDDITPYIEFVVNLNKHRIALFNMYSGGFSSLLLPFGLTGLINGPGYGLDKKIEPVQGGLPTAQFFIPTLRKRSTVFESYNLIKTNNLGNSKQEFHTNICNCPICQNGIVNDASDMLKFYGELGAQVASRDGRSRQYPTKEALERTTYHFILSRLIDFKFASTATKDEIITKLKSDCSLWSNNNENLCNWFKSLSVFK